MRVFRSLFMVVTLAVGATAAMASTAPSTILPQMLAALTAGEPRSSLSRFVDEADTNAATDRERLLLGEVLFVAGRPEEAHPHFERASGSSEDRESRLAAARVVLIELNARRNVAAAERGVSAYRERFAPVPTDVWGLYHVVNSLAARHRENGDHGLAVQVILDELAWLDEELPHPSYHLPFVFVDSFRAVGREALAAEVLAAAKRRLERAAHGASSQPLRECTRMEDIIDLDAGRYAIGTEVRCDLSYRYADLLEALDDALEQFD